MAKGITVVASTRLTHEQFLKEVVRRGIEGVKQSYNRPDQKDKLEGSILGFKDCLGKTIEGLAQLLKEAADQTKQARVTGNRYWYHRHYELQVEWVCNCVSCVLYNEKLPVIITPTARGMMLAAQIIGVSNA
jgi:hypothetical protein